MRTARSSSPCFRLRYLVAVSPDHCTPDNVATHTVSVSVLMNTIGPRQMAERPLAKRASKGTRPLDPGNRAPVTGIHDNSCTSGEGSTRYKWDRVLYASRLARSARHLAWPSVHENGREGKTDNCIDCGHCRGAMVGNGDKKERTKQGVICLRGAA